MKGLQAWSTHSCSLGGNGAEYRLTSGRYDSNCPAPSVQKSVATPDRYDCPGSPREVYKDARRLRWMFTERLCHDLTLCTGSHGRHWKRQGTRGRTLRRGVHQEDRLFKYDSPITKLICRFGVIIS
ncbi:unnamed protein product, partial [Scytosiphon promiscuus]